MMVLGHSGSLPDCSIVAHLCELCNSLLQLCTRLFL